MDKGFSPLVVSDCRSLVTWQPVGGTGVKFETVAETDGYVSIGLSDDKFMVSTQNKIELNHIYRPNNSVNGMSTQAGKVRRTLFSCADGFSKSVHYNIFLIV